jgi:hypothetical protein
MRYDARRHAPDCEGERRMKIPGDLDELTALFEKLGARRPELWARSQLREGINQLQSFYFLGKRGG